MQENNDIKILNKLYQCAEMGTIGIESVIDKAHQEEFRNTLHSQKEEYDKIGDQIVSILKKYGCEEKHIGTMAKKSSEMIEVAKLKNEYEGTDEEIMELMEHFLKTEQHNLDEMKKYL